MYRSIAAVIVLIAISFSHYLAYNNGKEKVQALWDKDKLEQTQQALKKQQQLQAEKQKAEERYVQEKRKAASAASDAKSELDRLRDTLTSASREESVSPSTVPRVNAGAGPERELLGHCASTLVAVAAEADRLETVVVGLQGYIKNVCLGQGK